MTTRTPVDASQDSPIPWRNTERGNFKLKFLDRYIGIFVIFFLRCVKFRRRPRPEKPRAIGILTNAAIGDTVIMSAAYRDIVATFPTTQVTVFATRSNREICEMLFGVERVILLDFLSPIKAIKIIRSRHFDILVDVGQWTRLNAILTYFSRADFTIGFRTAGQFKHYLYDQCVEHMATCHELYNFRNLVSAIGAAGSHTPQYKPQGDFPGVDRKFAVFHVAAGGTRSYLKQWPPGHWADLTDALIKKGYRVIFSGTATDKPAIQKVIECCRNTDGIENLAGKCSLMQTALLLARSFVVVSVDTGIMHLAAAVGCNVVSLHGPSPARRWGPLNSNSISIQSPYEKAPCLNLGFEFNCGNNVCVCMSMISPAIVMEAIARFEASASVDDNLRN